MFAVFKFLLLVAKNSLFLNMKDIDIKSIYLLAIYLLSICYLSAIYLLSIKITRNICPDISLLSIAIYCYLLLSIDIYLLSIGYLLISIRYLSDIYSMSV